MVLKLAVENFYNPISYKKFYYFYSIQLFADTDIRKNFADHKKPSPGGLCFVPPINLQISSGFWKSSLFTSVSSVYYISRLILQVCNLSIYMSVTHSFYTRLWLEQFKVWKYFALQACKLFISHTCK